VEFVIDQGLKTALKPEIARLNQYLESLARASDGYLGDLLHYVLINSGKRARPALVYLGSRLGKADPADVLTVEAAVELIHIATLVHDDVIDKAALRRGRKTVVNEEGVDTAVLLGDHIYTFAFQKAAELGRPNLLKYLARTTAEICSGEIEQLKSRYKFDISEQEYFSFIRKKTASLFGVSAQAGGILAGQSEPIQAALEAFGLNLGIAFQITDDLLDLTGEEAVVGKTLRTDLLNGKMTLPLIHFRDHLSTSSDQAELMATLQSPNGQLPDLIQKLKKAGSLDYSEQVADRHIQIASSQLSLLPAGEARDLLSSLADMFHDRKA
jgi:geranylgeranyl pyrophosphate synthase